MAQDNFEKRIALTAAQIVTATSSAAAASLELRDVYLDKDLNNRHVHSLFLLGTRGAYRKAGVVMQPMTVARFKDNLVKNFLIGTDTAENDYDRLKKKNLIATEPSPTDGREREVVLTEVGEALVEALGEASAMVILALADLIRSQGPVPTNPFVHAQPYVRDYALKMNRKKNNEDDE